jgi:starch phosphorylase
MHFDRYLIRPLPEQLIGLAELAVDMRWSWNHASDSLWRAIDPDLWDSTGNPWFLLETISQDRLDVLAADQTFLQELRRQLKKREDALKHATWFHDNHGKESLGSVAYFSMEFGLSEALPIYSGGLGILAGDYLKTASDLGVPLIGLGLLYQQGYFRQVLDGKDNQLEFYPYNDPAILPVMPLRDARGNWLRVRVRLPGRDLILRAWQVQVGRVKLYLLDSNDPLNTPGDRGITQQLYGGGKEIRLLQEIALGVGGCNLLSTMNIDCEVFHLNEGHAAFAVLERARSFMKKSGQPFHVALQCTRIGNVFTTHTPVDAAFDRYPPDMAAQYSQLYAKELGLSVDELLALGRKDPENHQEWFNMAYLALRGSGVVNGVSRLHGSVSRRIFQPLFPRWPEREVPVGYVTNGVHVPSWDSAASDALWTEACGKERWRGGLEIIEKLEFLSDEALWILRTSNRQNLVNFLRRRTSHQKAILGVDETEIEESELLFDPNVMTIGLARRFTAYKRPNLLLYDPDRLTRILTSQDRPVQLIIAGKAHPQDLEGKRMVKEWARYAKRPEVKGRVVFIQDYDMVIASMLVQGIDLWLNTSRRPWEASGTSGMKVIVNGGLNLSELDGWWAEAYCPEVGWALGDGREHGADPAWDATEALELYNLLEEDVIPSFYTRDEHGIPIKWVARMRTSMARLTPRFSANRMIRQYTEEYYLPLAAAVKKRTKVKGAVAEQLTVWRQAIRLHWQNIHFGEARINHADGTYYFQVPVYLNDLDPEAIQVQVYAEPRNDDTEAVIKPLDRGEKLPGTVNGYQYTGSVQADRPAKNYTLRIIPYHPLIHVPLEENHIMWYG